MKVLFVFPNLRWDPSPCIGIATLSAVLKGKLHDARLIYLNESIGITLDFKKIKGAVEDYQPDLIGFSATTNQFPVALKIAQFIKRGMGSKIPILFGGIHVTLNPVEAVAHDCIDMIVLGEGEGALSELVEKMQGDEDISKIKNLWLKRDGQIIKNDLRPYISSEQLPFMDVDVMDYQKIIDFRNGWVDLILSRGCPRRCTYCFNSVYKDIYKIACKEPGRYIRVGDYYKTIEGIKKILSKYRDVKAINFFDDDFLLSPSIVEFVKLFRKEINLPFIINTHVDSITEEKVSVLKSCGCDLIKIGLESGNYRIRRVVLNRQTTNQCFIEKSQIIKKHDIRLFTFNMIGLPTETENNVSETLQLNAQLKPDVVRVATFYPYEGTQIYFLCEKLGLLMPKNQRQRDLTYSSKSILNFDDNFKLFLLKTIKHLDCYLNYLDADVSVYYGEVVNEINSLSERGFNSKAKQKILSERIEKISNNLLFQSVPHYVKKFNPYYAVRV